MTKALTKESWQKHIKFVSLTIEDYLQQKIMKLTWFDANSWLLEAGGRRILVDPWLVGDLIFGGMDWLVRGIRKDPSNPERSIDIDIPKNIDLILLSQGLADHAHPQTLARLDKSIPVVASPDGAKVARNRGFKSVQDIGHGESLQIKDVKVQAFIGAPVGAMKKENAYVVTFLKEKLRLYYEPHGYPDAEHLKDIEPIDVVITPMADIDLLTALPVIRGSAAAVTLAELLRPQVMLPTAQNGRVTYTGLLAPVIKQTGGAEAIAAQLNQKGFEIPVVAPESGETVTLDLEAKRAEAQVG